MTSLLKLQLRRSSSTGGERFVRFSTTIYEGHPGAVSVWSAKEKICRWRNFKRPAPYCFRQIALVGSVPPLGPMVIALPNGKRRRIFVQT
jgi:hypothetical protein